MLFARKDEKNQKLAAMSMKIFDVILLSQVWTRVTHFATFGLFLAPEGFSGPN